MARPRRRSLTSEAGTEPKVQPSENVNREAGGVNIEPPSPGTAHDDSVAGRAYRRFEERGRKHGQDVDDWLEAERELNKAGDM